VQEATLVEEVRIMKKTIVAVALLLVASSAQSQELKKGNLVGMHVMTVNLEPNITIEQFTDFYVDRVIPEYKKYREGWKIYPVKRIRGEKANGLGLIIVIDSEASRDKFYNSDGSLSELGKAMDAKMQPVMEEMQKLGTVATDVYTDWLVY